MNWIGFSNTVILKHDMKLYVKICNVGFKEVCTFLQMNV